MCDRVIGTASLALGKMSPCKGPSRPVLVPSLAREWTWMNYQQSILLLLSRHWWTCFFFLPSGCGHYPLSRPSGVPPLWSSGPLSISRIVTLLALTARWLAFRITSAWCCLLPTSCKVHDNMMVADFRLLFFQFLIQQSSPTNQYTIFKLAEAAEQKLKFSWPNRTWSC
jgi:hypothetical protein